MGLNEVKKQIIEEAEKQAKLLTQDAQSEIKLITADAEREVKSYEKELRSNSDKMLAAVERKELAAAEFEGKRAMLDKKKEIIEGAMDAARSELKKLSADSRKKLIKELLEQAKKEIEVKKVYLNKKDKSYIKEKGITVKDKEMLGGLIAETSDGKISVDLSYEEMLMQIKEKYLQELSGVLFGD